MTSLCGSLLHYAQEITQIIYCFSNNRKWFRKLFFLLAIHGLKPFQTRLFKQDDKLNSKHVAVEGNSYLVVCRHCSLKIVDLQGHTVLQSNVLCELVLFVVVCYFQRAIPT